MDSGPETVVFIASYGAKIRSRPRPSRTRVKTMARFPNLAGKRDDKTPALELEAAEIKVSRLPEVCRYGEPKTVIIGELAGWSFQRAWYYWVAEGPGIDVETAEQLHAAHGSTVRVDGHCGCPSPREWFKGLACGHYHVDSSEGLKALAETIKSLTVEDQGNG